MTGVRWTYGKRTGRLDRIAEEQGRNISALFRRFIRLLARHDRSGRTGAVTRRATGLIEIPDGVSVEEVLTEALVEKHGLGP